MRLGLGLAYQSIELFSQGIEGIELMSQPVASDIKLLRDIVNFFLKIFDTGFEWLKNFEHPFLSYREPRDFGAPSASSSSCKRAKALHATLALCR